jgi:two-component system, OmpR family, sensor histidine kinase VicK
LVKNCACNYEIWNIYKNAQSRGIRLRYITEITEDNIAHCKHLMSIADVRHLPKISGILLVTDNEFFSDIDPLPFSASSPLMYSNFEDVVKQELRIFNRLWNEGITVEERIKQIQKIKDQIETRIIETPTQFHNFMIFSLKDAVERNWYFEEKILKIIYENYFDLFKKNMNEILLYKRVNQNNKTKSDIAKKDNNVIGLRCIVKITRENVELVSKFLEIEGVYIRHTSNPLPLNFEVSNNKFNLSIRRSNKKNSDTPFILSTQNPSLIKYYKFVFEDQWNQSLDARIRIKDIRNLTTQEGFTELIENPYKIQQLLINNLKAATTEILIILPSINAFFRYHKIGVFNILGKKILYNNKKEDQNKLIIKILTPTNNELNKSIISIYNRIKKINLQKENIEFRRIEPLSEINTACIIVDKKKLLVIELKDDSKDNFLEAIGSSTYSNIRSTVFSYVSIFETLWTQTELYESIRTTNNELQSTTEELKESLQILAKVNRELTVTNEQLNKHDRIQKEFINVAAHELRTPTQSIVGYCEMIDAFPENTQKYLEPVKRNAEKLYRLTEDILDVSRIESGTLKLEKIKFDLREIIVSLIEDLTTKKKKEDAINSDKRHKTDKNANIQLVYPELPVQPIFIYADKNRIQQVISNLLSNALKFTENGIITITMEKFKDNNNNNSSDDDEKKEFVCIKIKDTGKGIDPEVLPRLFEKFATKSDRGTGLGLYISKNIVEAHEGKIWGMNNNNNRYGEKGAEFGFTLPLYNVNI